MKNPFIAITGTNGKTTTTSLLNYIFNNSGRKAVAAGNIGLALSQVAMDEPEDTVVVAELSSFQLDRIDTFAPDIAIILNISPDHIGYHGTYENYKNAKFQIFSRQSPKNLLILNGDDNETLEAVNKTQSQVLYFSDSPTNRGIFVDGDIIKIIFDEQHNEEKLMRTSELGLPGIHNRYNSLAAALAARVFEINNENIRESLMTFKGVEHRLEFVRNLNNIEFINDSKATNINATWYALSSYKKPLIWIAGGRGDNNDYSVLNDFVKKNVKAIVALGEEQDAIFNHFCTSVRCIKATSMEDAVQKAAGESADGDVVLFSPACKSFDMFMNYEHRGEVYKECVNNL